MRIGKVNIKEEESLKYKDGNSYFVKVGSITTFFQHVGIHPKMSCGNLDFFDRVSHFK